MNDNYSSLLSAAAATAALEIPRGTCFGYPGTDMFGYRKPVHYRNDLRRLRVESGTDPFDSGSPKISLFAKYLELFRKWKVGNALSEPAVTRDESSGDEQPPLFI